MSAIADSSGRAISAGSALGLLPVKGSAGAISTSLAAAFLSSGPAAAAEEAAEDGWAAPPDWNTHSTRQSMRCLRGSKREVLALRFCMPGDSSCSWMPRLCIRNKRSFSNGNTRHTTKSA